MSDQRNQISIDPDGAWCWVYRMDLIRNRSMLVYILVPIYICMGIFLLCAYFMKLNMKISLIVTVGMSVFCTVLALLIYFIGAYVTAGKYRIPYYMNETLITVHIGNPEIKMPEKWDDNQMIRFSNINLIRLKRDVDMILLGDVLPFQVYVPKESYDRVLNFILEHVKPKVREKFEQSEDSNTLPEPLHRVAEEV